MVKTQPRTYGVRRAQLKLEAYSAIDGQTLNASVVLQVDAKIGGLPNLHPGYAPISTGRSGADRLLLLENSGDRNVVRGRISLANGLNFLLVPGDAQQVLAPGESEVIRVRFSPTCPSAPPYRATDQIKVETDWGDLTSDLSGYGDCTQ
jgi:hypothetical protein